MERLNSIRLQRAGQTFDLFDTFFDTLFDTFFPKGFVYTQYPTCKGPNEMWGDYSTWEPLNFFGAFFRTPGGNALDFEKKATITSVSGTTLTMASEYSDVKSGCILYDPVGNEGHFVYTVSGTTITIDSPFTNTSITELYIGQEDSFQTHTHTYYRLQSSGGLIQTGGGNFFGNHENVTYNTTGRNNSNETRAVNFTYILWKRVS